jgi:trans-aconitate methyltransferase
MKSQTDARVEWNSRTADLEAVEVESVAFKRLFDHYLPKNPRFRCLEVGAIPGTFLVYLHKRHGYRITGIDFADNESVFHDTMRINGVAQYEFVHGDFLDYHPANTFDVVLSFGFVEHFDDYVTIIQRHCAFVDDDGFVVITMPNFRRLQFVYHALFDRKNLLFHNLDVMDIDVVDTVLSRCGFTKRFAGYEGGLEFWTEERPKNVLVRAIEVVVRSFANKIGPHVPNSSLYSPHLVFIYSRAHT